MENVFELELVPDRSRAVETDCLLPLEEKVTLELEGKSYFIPNNLPTYGIIRDTERSIILVQLEEPARSVYPPLLAEDASIHILRIQNDSYRKIGIFDLRKAKFQDINQIGLAIYGEIEVSEGEVKNAMDFFHEPNTLAGLIGGLIAEIGLFRYWLKLLGATIIEEWEPFSPEDVEIEIEKPNKIVQGQIKHSHVKRMQLAVPFPLTEPVVARKDGTNFSIEPSYIVFAEHRQQLPVIGIYTHPFDDKKICLARLHEQRNPIAPRNRIYVTELGEEERMIGDLYFRVLDDKILADGFDIGNPSFGRLLTEREAQQYRGKGLGSRVLETAEELFKERYGKNLVVFEGEFDFLKRSVRHNRGNFFRNNYYTKTKSGQGMNIDIGCTFEKHI